MYYRGSAAAVIVYDITKLVSLLPSLHFPLPVLIALVVIKGQIAQKYVFHIVPVPQLSACCALVIQDSFQTLKKWVKELKEHGPDDIVVAIAGNKNDLGDIRWLCFHFGGVFV